MSLALITAGGIGDVLHGLSAATLYALHNDEPVDIYVNSHQEITDFINKCTYFNAISCPARVGTLPDPENPLNLPVEFLDKLHKDYSLVHSCFPDSLGQAPFAFPWYKYVKSYKAFMQTKVWMKTSNPYKWNAINENTKNIFIHATSVTLEKNYPMPALQKLVELLNQTNYNVIICRSSQWKGMPLPFYCQGKYIDLVDRPIDEVVSVMSQCDYFVGIDSGPAHIAYHLGLPRLVLQHQHNQPFHLVRYHEDYSDDVPLNTAPEILFHRIAINLRDPLTQAIPAQFHIPQNINTKQLLYKKYYV